MCSTFKFLAVAAVLGRVDLQHERLESFVPYTEADLLAYAPITRQHVHDGGMTLEALCAAAIEYSDNTAGNLLLQRLGGPAGLTDYARSIGDAVTRLDRTEPDLNTVRAGDARDTTTPAAMLRDMRELLTGHRLSENARSRLEDWMVHNTTGQSMIRAALPVTWRVGDKTGRNVGDVSNDIAIIRLPNRPPLLLCVFIAEAPVAADVRDAAIAQVAKLVVQVFTGDR
jgi:beta-lactamase class A